MASIYLFTKTINFIGVDPDLPANDMKTTVHTIVQNLGSEKVAKILSVWKDDVMNSFSGVPI